MYSHCSWYSLPIEISSCAVILVGVDMSDIPLAAIGGGESVGVDRGCDLPVAA
jgi:hypothetical protein